MNSDEIWRQQEQQRQEQRSQEQKLQEEQLREQQFRDRQLRDRQLQDQRLQEQQRLQDQQLRDRQLQDQQLQDQQLREQKRLQDQRLREEPAPNAGAQAQQSEQKRQRDPVLSQATKQKISNQSLQITLVDFQLNPKSYMEGMNQRAFVNLSEKFYEQQQRKQELHKHLQDFPGDWRSQNELKKVDRELQISQRVTSHTEKFLLQRGELNQINVSDLKQWKQEAEALRLAGTRAPEHLGRIEAIERRAATKPESQTVSLLKIEQQKMQEDRHEFQEFSRKAKQILKAEQSFSKPQNHSFERHSSIPDSLRAKVEVQREKYSTTERQPEKSQEIER